MARASTDGASRSCSATVITCFIGPILISMVSSRSLRWQLPDGASVVSLMDALNECAASHPDRCDHDWNSDAGVSLTPASRSNPRGSGTLPDRMARSRPGQAAGPQPPSLQAPRREVCRVDGGLTTAIMWIAAALLGQGERRPRARCAAGRRDSTRRRLPPSSPASPAARRASAARRRQRTSVVRRSTACRRLAAVYERYHVSDPDEHYACHLLGLGANSQLPASSAADCMTIKDALRRGQSPFARRRLSRAIEWIDPDHSVQWSSTRSCMRCVQNR